MKLNKFIKNVAIGAVMALSTAAASAGNINVGGVIFNPDAAFDFTAKGQLFESVLTSPTATGTFNGYGFVNNLNDAESSDFCPNCQITYTFGGFVFDPTQSTATKIVFSAGWINFYVQDKSAPGYTAYSSTNGIATAGDGTLWLGLVGHTDIRNGNTGTLFGSVTNNGVVGSGAEAGNGGGLFDVVSGVAAANLNTNSFADAFGGFADFNFSSEFQPTLPGAITAGAFPLSGNATLSGNSIPEPGTMFLVGLGLLGVAFGSKRRKQRNA